ncbi:ABC transporter substrate-binding protein [Paraburkholderia sp. MMS20-SJTR3]|uniref:ABC transporter substrate-binding protein n=1 Tax=Paraburkholderia sejongensis TaxID=2886946 RepID=A0ABS8JRN4_9BURK|nr:ABC transporter substrate-binding protein [Paraburkholderia sp. MMS20-SJTR3]MCC8392383.1 ABC transporter substrate-binding protein [Paraburkholderia sp. MMS20-SJTR3]
MKLRRRGIEAFVTLCFGLSHLPDAHADASVGAVLPLTGSSASIGEDQRRGIELAVAKINAQGGVLGQKLQVRIEDSGGGANTALDAARKLSTVEHVPVVLGEFSSSITIPVGQFLVRQGDVHVNIGSSSQQIRKIGPGSFSVIGLDNLSARFAAQDVFDRKLRRVAFIAPNNGYGQGIADEFRKRFEALGGTVAAVVLYTEGQSTYRRELEQMARANPDAYVYSAYGQEAATINRQAYDMQLNRSPWYGIYLTMCTSDTPPQIARGQIGLEVASGGAGAKAYEQAYEAAYKEKPRSAFGSYAYDATMLSAAAINHAHSTDPAKIRSAFDALGNAYAGVTGAISFDSDGQRIAQPYEKVSFKQTVAAQ